MAPGPFDVLELAMVIRWPAAQAPRAAGRDASGPGRVHCAAAPPGHATGARPLLGRDVGGTCRALSAEKWGGMVPQEAQVCLWEGGRRGGLLEAPPQGSFPK